MGVVDAVKHESDPLNVQSDLGEDGVLVRIAEEGRLPSRAEADDTLDFPSRQIAREKQETAATVAVA